MAKSKRGRPKKKKIQFNTEETGIVFAIIFMMAAGISLVSLFVDAPYFDYIHKYLGWGIPVAVVFFGAFSLRLFGYKFKLTSNQVLIGQLFLFLSIDALLHIFLSYDKTEGNEALEFAMEGSYGGMLGYWIGNFFDRTISRMGGVVVILPVLVVSASLATGLSLLQMRDLVKSFFGFFVNIASSIRNLFNGISSSVKDERVVASKDEKGVDVGDEKRRMVGELSGQTKVSVSIKPKSPSSSVTKSSVDLNELVSSVKVTGSDYANWRLPPIDLLNAPLPQEDVKEDLSKNANIIEQTLDSFGVQAKVSDIASGPTVTQYALDIAMGTKVSRIKNLAGDLALALAAPSGAVRIEAPIPGTSLVGVEVPNAKPKLVTIREIIESEEMQNPKLRLGAALGKNVSGKNEVLDIQKMPHMLIAGATGSGKSILMNAFLVSLLMKLSPADLRMILVDPKMVELSLYNGIPHLLTPVITEMDKVVNSLKWALVEMQRRYSLFKQNRVRNMQEFNELRLDEHLPYIIIFIDEMADLMMTAGAEVETNICRIAQMARATGIHLVLATQRPSVNVLTGLIKANVPARIGMSVATSVDSRVILDQIGAETLLGNGDMLYKSPQLGKPYRVQGALVENAEIERVIEFIKKQAGDAVEYEETVVESQESDIDGGNLSNEDDLFADVLRFVCAKGKASASQLQRRFRVGYNRAARLMDIMEENGIIGAPNGSKPRDVLIADAESYLSGGAEDAVEE